MSRSDESEKEDLVEVELPNGTKLLAQRGEILRTVLPRDFTYNTPAKWIHCRGIGTCGTCALVVMGDVSPMTRIEKWRLSFPPHKLTQGLRLACQARVLGNVKIVKLKGLWGNR